MKVLIPIDFKPEGGGFYFLQLLEKHFEAIGWQVTREFSDHYDFVFTNHWMVSRGQILKAIRSNPKVRIIHRIDGVAQDYGRDPEADVRQGQVNRIADLTIFQSEYARYAAREKYSVIKQDGPVIHNPVDVDFFFPTGENLNFNGPNRVICVSWSTNPLKGSYKIYTVAKKNPRIDFLLCGNYPDAPGLSNLYRMGPLSRSELAKAYRSCQVLLTFSKNEACPNHVLEALASGLPVLYDDSGATSELVGECGEPVTVDHFSDQFRRIIATLPSLSALARQSAVSRFRPQIVFPKYVDAIQESLLKPTYVPHLARMVAAWTGTF